MKFKTGDKVKTFFGSGIIKQFLEKESMVLYQVEMTENHKGKLPWFAEHELELIETKQEKPEVKYQEEDYLDDTMGFIIRQK